MTLKEMIKQKQKLIATHVSLDEVCTAIQKLRKGGKYIGLMTGDIRPEILQHWHDMDLDLIIAGMDFCMLKEAYSQAAQNLRAVHLQQK